ncbi:MAG TPA: ABC transporter ATP-binding protein [Anaerolineales bacterium]|nr:ABC transporter ATP-binding protein [Anaerolineales bacterium]
MTIGTSAALEVQHLTKRFLSAQHAAIKDISFEMENGEMLALVGPSGCGKTTTLRLIAGLERPDAGLISLDGQVLASETKFVPPERRGIGMVFQDHALFPHLTVFENVAFGLRGRKPAELRAAVSEMLHLVGMESLANRYPHELSGGERQRVALVRALAPRPALLLLDEPFSSLDADLRREVREQVRGILKSIRATVIFVTHDQEEALYMGDRLAVYQRGRLEQIGTPEEIFHSSATRFVAEFMGNSDFLQGRVVPEGVRTAVGLLSQAIGINGSNPVEVALRADDVDFEVDETGNAVISERFFRGAFNVYRLLLDSGQVLHAFKEHTVILPVGSRVRAYISAGHPLVVFHEGRAVSGG